MTEGRDRTVDVSRCEWCWSFSPKADYWEHDPRCKKCDGTGYLATRPADRTITGPLFDMDEPDAAISSV